MTSDTEPRPPAHDAAAIAEIAKGLTKAQLAILPHMSDGQLVYPLPRIVEDLPGNLKLYREAVAGLRSLGLAKHGPLYDEDGGAPNGSGTWLTPLGLAVRASLAQSKGEE